MKEIIIGACEKCQNNITNCRCNYEGELKDRVRMIATKCNKCQGIGSACSCDFNNKIKNMIESGEAKILKPSPILSEDTKGIARYILNKLGHKRDLVELKWLEKVLKEFIFNKKQQWEESVKRDSEDAEKFRQLKRLLK